MESQFVGGVSHELHNTMPLSAIITRVQRNLLRVRTILFGVRLLHECTLDRLLDAKCTWTKLDPDGYQWPPTYSTGSKQLSIVAIS